jgi:hypothetical protein
VEAADYVGYAVVAADFDGVFDDVHYAGMGTAGDDHQAVVAFVDQGAVVVELVGDPGCSGCRIGGGSGRVVGDLPWLCNGFTDGLLGFE